MPPARQTPGGVAMPEPQMDSATLLLLGEIRGQMRELIHSFNNTALKVDALSARLSALEAEHNRRQGATNVVTALVGSRALGWLVGAAITAWAILTGKVHV